MKRILLAALWLLLSLVGPVWADSSVVFNEIMYHPATNEPALEWVELHNQLAVDVDMSNWFLDGGIYYKFGANVVLKGGGFLVVAVAPTNLVAVTGATNVFGPFTNRLSNSGQKLQLKNNNGRVVNEVTYGTDGDWPVAADGAGVSLAKIDRTTASQPAANWTSSAQMGGTPGRENFLTTPSLTPLVFNELSAPTTNGFWFELANYGTNSIALAGYVVAWAGLTNAEYVLPAGTLAAGGFLALSNTTLGFLPLAGDQLFLLPPARTNVLDAVVLKNSARARLPNGVGPWLRPTTLTPGASNNIVLRDEIVINEIMYKHQSLPVTNTFPPVPSSEEWIELFNKSTNTVDLTGWKLAGGISFDFPAGKFLNPGAYLVVAKNAAALSLVYPAVDILGNFGGTFSASGDSVVLEDAAGNPADRVRYYDSGHWPEAAAGGGSSLELRDPNADNNAAETWAASDESGKSSWQTFTNRAVAQNIVGPEQWNDFILGLLNSGECLVDDISVVETPTTTPVQFIANGNFESGATGWRMLGNHIRSRVETDPGNAANHVLHVVASGPQEDLHNHDETTYTAGRKVTNGRLYEISYRVKWLSGNNRVNTRLYYDRVASTFIVPTPQLNGTPGAQNSRFAGNIGPTFTQFKHTPTIPAANAAVTVSVVAQDPQGVSSCQVFWSTNSGAFSSATMTNRGNGLFVGAIPGLPAGRIVQFYVRAVDGLGAAATYPAASTNSGALYMVADGLANLSLGHNVRVVMTPANWGLMRALTNLMSNDWLPCTVITDEQRAYYDMKLRMKGSQSGRFYDTRPSFHLSFNPDDLFRGVHPNMNLDSSGLGNGSPNQQLEIVIHHMALTAGGIPEVQPDMCRAIPLFSTNTGPAVLIPKHEDEFIDTAYQNGGDGSVFLLELTYYPTTTNSAGYKLPNPQIYTGVDIGDLGTDKEIYRYNFILKNHHDEDDYTDFIPFARSFSLPNGPTLQAQAQQVVDLNEWLRVFAFVSLVGEVDWYSFGNNHNMLMYQRPTDHRLIAFPTDIEQVFLRPASSTLLGVASDWTDIASFPENKRRLYAHAQNLMATSFNTSYMNYWVSHYATFAPGQSFTDLLSYITARTSAINTEINTAGGNAAFAVTSGATINTASNLVTLTGTAPVSVQSIRINGVDYPITWNSISSWTVRIPVSQSSTALNLVGYDVNGNALTNFTANVTVNYSGNVPDPAGAVVLNEICYNPAFPEAGFIELRNGYTNLSFDLSGWSLNGLGYTFPPGSVLTNRQIITLAENRSSYISTYGTTNTPFDQYSGNLQPDGETLTLQRPGAVTNTVVVVDKVRYAATLPWPTNVPGASLQLIDAAQDHSRVADWAAAIATPLAANSVPATLPAIPPLWINEVQPENLTGITNSAGQRTAWIELFNAGTNAIGLTNLFLARNYTNLTAWAFPSNAVLAPGQFKVIFCDALTNLSSTNEPHANFSLAPGGGSLALSRIYNSQPQVLDYVNYTNLIPNRSFGSYRDGQNFDRQQFYFVTPGGSNNGSSAPLTVVINELMAGNTHTLTNPTSGKFSDWFELFNYGTNNVPLDGFYLTDALTNQFKFAIPAGYVIPARGFLLVWADGKATNGTVDLHTTFKLAKTGGSIGLYGADGVPVDFLNYGTQTDDVSLGRFPDGAIDSFFMPTATPRTNNVIPNTAPTVNPIGPKYLHAGQTLHFTATATDAESAFQTLAFSLDAGAPSGASIGTVNGAFTWTATNTPVPGTNSVTVRVTDNGLPALSGTAGFAIIVLAPPSVTTAGVVGGNLPLAFATLPGQNYQVEYKDNLDDAFWSPLGPPVVGTGNITQVTDPVLSQSQRFYRLSVLP